MLKKAWQAWARSFAAIGLGTCVFGCLDRPLCSGEDCQPQTTNQFVVRVPTGGIDKLDLVFMIDNSASMADKQVLLRQAVPVLLGRFVNPLCVGEDEKPNGEVSNAGQCSRGTAEFPPVLDMHIAVISSALGNLGTDNCGGAKHADDKAWLLPLVRSDTALSSWNNSGFLAWDPTGTRNSPSGTRQSEQLRTEFQNLVTAAGETGCGYEASLESWYRFLIAPDPPTTVTFDDQFQVHTSGIDTALIAQRDQFLRSDSLVAVVMLTDENDCSIAWSGQGALVGNLRESTDPSGSGRMPRAMSACQNPSDPCCRPCQRGEVTPPNCVSFEQDPACQQERLTPAEDPVGLRCMQQKRRFGFDFLEPVDKYVQGLTSPTVLSRDGKTQPNPLFVARHGKPQRNRDLVFLAGIVGVPWQDIATADSLTNPSLRYLTARELKDQKRWELILGDPERNLPPTDPHMIESHQPRSGSHPFLPNATIAPTTATSPRADVISGHESPPTRQGEPQYACIYELPAARDCSAMNTSCDCSNADESSARALCQPPTGGPGGKTQYYAKAYPATRVLQVLKGLGDQAVLASICAKQTQSDRPEADPAYGYNAAVDALVNKLRVPLASQCLSRAPSVDEQGQAACVVLEANLGAQCDCSLPGRRPARPSALSLVRQDLVSSSSCGAAGQPSCDTVCGCELSEAKGEALSACRSTADATRQAPGYCYVDPAKGLGDPLLVKDCPATRKKLVRFVGDRTPVPGSFAYMACLGKALD